MRLKDQVNNILLTVVESIMARIRLFVIIESLGNPKVSMSRNNIRPNLAAALCGVSKRTLVSCLVSGLEGRAK